MMKRSVKLLDLDCACCAAKIEDAVRKLEGVTEVSVNFMGQRMTLEAPDDRFDALMEEAAAIVRRLEPDVTVQA